MQLLEKLPGKVNLVIKHYPLASHKAAFPAAMAALAASKQGKYKEFSALLFKNYKTLTPYSIQQYAMNTGLDMSTFEKDLRSPALRDIVSKDINDARKCKINGVPAIIINGKKIRDRSPQNLLKAIEQELQKNK